VAKAVGNVRCPVCGHKYRSKLKRGVPTRGCPACNEKKDERRMSPVPEVRGGAGTSPPQDQTGG